jgi:uncharacterized protein with ACT and thioredoxin-like domain
MCGGVQAESISESIANDTKSIIIISTGALNDLIAALKESQGNLTYMQKWNVLETLLQSAECVGTARMNQLASYLLVNDVATYNPVEIYMFNAIVIGATSGAMSPETALDALNDLKVWRKKLLK